MATGWIITLGLAALVLLGVGVGVLQAHAQRQAWRSILGESPAPRRERPPRARPEECRTCRTPTVVLDEHVRRTH
ncbi:hypothetical protein [Pseudonocardia sp. WMMC193]|uniref:hypothetical protein n=1 Tax=Pseudonocardia sp. WMMC193 TaxID=2911965 RepID=UPI001F26D6A0|nr:hypothetical protein [Pseudonocardia sp. WMMC193]MCF7551668.1 hypothetical protein [Pseudonocardia sp. WMMC193]